MVRKIKPNQKQKFAYGPGYAFTANHRQPGGDAVVPVGRVTEEREERGRCV